MAALLLQPAPPIARQCIPRALTNRTGLKAARPRTHSCWSRLASAFITSAVADSARVVDDTNGNGSELDDIKADLYQALEGINRGIFGAKSSTKSEIARVVELLESQNPTPNPTDYLQEKILPNGKTRILSMKGFSFKIFLVFGKVDGCWKLVYSTISILGTTRTKLGLRDFIILGDFFQIIDVAKEKATNVIKFNLRGLTMLTGQLTIEASFSIVSKTRVVIKLENSTITPNQLMKIFEKNLDILLGIFNPEGWLEITYLDDTMRIGRDDEGNIFVLERSEDKQV